MRKMRSLPPLLGRTSWMTPILLASWIFCGRTAALAPSSVPIWSTFTSRHSSLTSLRLGGYFSSPLVKPSRRGDPRSASTRLHQYVPQTPKEDVLSPATKQKNPLHPKVGDVVRYYDLDGGRADGQVLVGKISFLQKNLSKANDSSGWLAELVELDDVGDGYFAEYPNRQRLSKRATRDLALISPIAASFVGRENAFKVPMDSATNRPRVRAERYDWEDYEGPFGENNVEIDQTVIEEDAEVYAALKSRLFRYAAIAGVAGTLIADLLKGTEDAVIYGAGALASLLYLFFLSIKTDTLAQSDSKLGSNVSNVRFAMPLLVLIGVSFYNASRGEANPVQSGNLFETVTVEQFMAAVLGFLTYRIPLFLSQLQDAFVEGEAVLPGSAGVAMQLAKGAKEGDEGTGLELGDLTTVLLVSGPQATGRSELVKRFIDEGQGKFVEPKRVDAVKESAAFERLQQREEFLTVDPSGRYGLTKEGILSAVDEDKSSESVVVVDADVELAKQLAKLPRTRLIGVWVGLNSVKDFEDRISQQLDQGSIPLPEDETRESVMRAKIREIVQEIEFGISSGIFEFTILNEDEEESMQQLRAASSYCFK